MNCEKNDFADILRTFEPDLYIQKIREGQGFNTTLPPLVLVSAMAATIRGYKSTIEDQAELLDIQNCSIVYRDVITVVENKYMSKEFVNKFPKYRQLRDNFIVASFRHEHPHFKNTPLRNLQQNQQFKRFQKRATDMERGPVVGLFSLVVRNV